ncbi:MAG TPA: oligosaccharide flippase family protein, partial [Blastocatellia bacterium]|nr:oligosaccharide flippase family protein [Blastocatellia bacterium]
MQKPLPGTAPRRENNSEPLSRSTARAALASGTAQIVTRVLAVVLSIASARALEPREVGLLGLAVIVMSVISMIGYYPETAAVVAGETENHQKYAAASAIIRAASTVFLLLVTWLAFLPLSRYLAGTEDGSQSLRSLIVVLAGVPLFEFISAYPRVL